MDANKLKEILDKHLLVLARLTEAREPLDFYYSVRNNLAEEGE